MDAIGGLLHNGLDGSPEALDLPPQRLQAGQVVIHVDHHHLSAWMYLRAKEEKKELSKRGGTD